MIVSNMHGVVNTRARVMVTLEREEGGKLYLSCLFSLRKEKNMRQIWKNVKMS